LITSLSFSAYVGCVRQLKIQKLQFDTFVSTKSFPKCDCAHFWFVFRILSMRVIPAS